MTNNKDVFCSLGSEHVKFDARMNEHEHHSVVIYRQICIVCLYSHASSFSLSQFLALLYKSMCEVAGECKIPLKQAQVCKIISPLSN